MLSLYADLNPIRLGVLEVLRQWQKALENCFVYLGGIETTLTDIRKLEEKVMEIFNIEMKPGYHVVQASYTHKVGCVPIVFGFSDLHVNASSIENVRKVASGLLMFFDLKSLDYARAGPLLEQRMKAAGFTWVVSESNLRVSEEGCVVTKTARGNASLAIGSQGWMRGIHSWKLLLNGKIAGQTTRNKLHYIVVGVATEKIQRTMPNSLHVEGHTFGKCTCCNQPDHGEGSETIIPPGTTITLTLDCDMGTLAFRVEKEFLKIKVPRNTLLYPWVFLGDSSNSVTIVNK
eukprot:TRINITY_DN2506_c0_g1_i2.p1 TRINITY_DN2506_c0_g1~~TRINITY_DN2506_c0_g1_i2.p1  ORF type:complete len:289 (-),score=17.70 TRINITY_DN2506_c0_g1_i2:14-880(-)